MKYVKENTVFSSYPTGYYQIFLHSTSTTSNKAKTLELFESGMVDKRDLMILEFLVDVEFATKAQLERFAKLKDIDNLEQIISVGFANNLLNKFGIVEDKKNDRKLPSDAEIIFCLAEGGHQLLENLVDEFIIWASDRITKGSRSVAKQLIDTEVYLSMMENPKIPLTDYEKHPYYMIRSKLFTAGSHMRFEFGEHSHNYIILDVVNSDDSILRLRQKFRNYESLLATNIWRKYYPDTNVSPLLVIVTDSDDFAFTIADEITALAPKISENQYRITTGERLKKGLNSEEAFLIFDKDRAMLLPTGIAVFNR